VRLAGVYAMARLADDWEDQRQTCIDVLCAYLRMPTPVVEFNAGMVDDPADLRVRECIWSVIRDRVGDGAQPSWRRCNFDFSDASIHHLTLIRVVFNGFVTFENARLLGEVRLDDVLFRVGASFDRCRIEGKVRLSDVRTSEFGSLTFRYISVVKDQS
jgi:hypothetical protein